MGLRHALRRAAVSRPGVLCVARPGATAIRLAVEAEVRRLGWPVVESPAAANLLLVAGAHGPRDAEWLEAVWRQAPHPKGRVHLHSSDEVRAELEAAAARLRAVAQEGRSASAQDGSSADSLPTGAMDHGHHDGQDDPASCHDADGHRHHGHGGEPSDPDPHHGSPTASPGRHQSEQQTAHQTSTEDHAAGDHQNHAHGHAGHDMSDMTVAGLPMADRADDRDGLRLDRLHVPLGPALANWPTGLILRTALQGDVVQQVDVEYVSTRTHEDPFWSAPWLRASRGEEVTRDEAARRRCAAHLDSLGRLLAVTGWRDPAARARRLRDEVLAGATVDRVGDDLKQLVRRMSRSRTLRWLTTGMGPLPASRAHEWGISGPALVADGDVHDRFRVWLDEAARAVDGFGDRQGLGRDEVTGPRGRVDGGRPPSAALLAALPELLGEAEFAAARIIVASLDPDIDELVAVPARERGHG
ncbi:hypothetical protein ACWCQ1_28980 [Streptomyces sp. NPDC002144]